jgi:hypothetical protein
MHENNASVDDYEKSWTEAGGHHGVCTNDALHHENTMKTSDQYSLI